MPSVSSPTDPERSAPSSPVDVVGVDVGGTKTLAAMVRVTDGVPQVLDTELAPSGAGDDGVLVGIVAAVRALVDRQPTAPAALGAGLAGFVDLNGVVRHAPNAAGLVGHDVAALLRSELGLDCVVDNDANCVAVSAQRLLSTRPEHLVAVTLGTGIGGGIISAGRLVRGGRGFAGEPGHMVVDPSGPACPCGQRGCWERYASGSGLGWLAQRAVDAGRLDAAVVGGADGTIRGEDVVAALGGDAAVDDVFDEFVGYVALGIANVIALLDPQVVVIGGGVSGLGARLLDPVVARLRSDHAAVMVDPGVQVTIAPGGPRSGAMGAGVLAAELGSDGAPVPGA